MNSITIYIDTREQRPLKFGDVLRTHTVTSSTRRSLAHIKLSTLGHRLETGDYAISLEPDAPVIERKLDLGELATNLLTDDRPRFLRCLDRLAARRSPLLLIESPTLPRHPAFDQSQIPLIWDHILRETLSRGIHLATMRGTSLTHRLETADFVARYLYQAHHLSHLPAVTPDMPESPS